MQVYLGNTPMDFRGIQLGNINIQTITMDKFLNLDYLVVGGGGAGQDGGGGAGGYVTGSVTVSSAVYQVVVGTGGIANTYPSSTPSPAQFGNPSAFTGSAFAFNALGGGRGGGGNTPQGDGGSGGGGGFSFQSGGAGTAPQGFNGGAGGGADEGAAGGGGGAAEVGANYAFGGVAGRGGNGKQWLDGNYYAGGGGGGTRFNSGTQPGGLGGGGNGSSEFVEASPGTPNTGGGGGGYWTSATPRNPKNGGSGVVIIRYPGGTQADGGTITQSGGYTYHTFTSSSQFIVTNQSV